MKIASLILAATVVGLAFPCAAQSLNYEDIKAHVVPEADSPEEARVCAAELSYTYLLLTKTEGVEQETLINFGDMMDYWIARSAAINGMTPAELMKDKTFIKETAALALIDTDTHIYFAGECLKRMG